MFFDANTAKRFSQKLNWDTALKELASTKKNTIDFLEINYLNKNLIVSGNLVCEFLYISLKRINSRLEGFLKNSSEFEIKEFEENEISTCVNRFFENNLQFYASQEELLKKNLISRFEKNLAEQLNASVFHKIISDKIIEFINNDNFLHYFFCQLALDSLDRFTKFLIPKNHPQKINIIQGVSAKISSSHLAILELKKNVSGYRRINLDLNEIIRRNKINNAHLFTADDLKDLSDSVDAEIPHFLSIGWFENDRLFPVWVFTDDLKEKIISRTQQYQTFIIYASKPPKSYLPQRISLSHTPGRSFCFDMKKKEIKEIIFKNPEINGDEITMQYDFGS